MGMAERVRITMELIRVSDESRIWGENFDRETWEFAGTRD